VPKNYCVQAVNIPDYCILNPFFSLSEKSRTTYEKFIARELRKKYHLKGLSGILRIDNYTESFLKQKKDLGDQDILNILLLLNSLNKGEVKRRITTYIDLDLEDTDTEYGGIVTSQFASLDPNESPLQFISIPPEIKKGNNIYCPQEELLKRVNKGEHEFHFHLHTFLKKEITNKNIDPQSFHGPSIEDLNISRSENFKGVVISSTNDRSFNVDYYNPEGKVIDLGFYNKCK